MTDKKNFSPKFEIYSPDVFSSKKWCIYFYDETGKRVRKYGDINKFSTREERFDEANRLIEDIKEKLQLSEPVISLKDTLYTHLEQRRSQWRDKTYGTIKSKLDNLFAWLGKRELTNITLQAFFYHLTTTRRPGTIKCYHNQLKPLLIAAGAGDMLDGIKPAKKQSTPARFFQQHQVRRLKRHIQPNDPELWLFIEFIFYCFIRPGELRFLRAGDILLDEDRILMRGEISKNKKTEYVAIPAAFKDRLEFIKDLRPDELVFPSKRGAHIGFNTMNRRHRAFLKALGFGVEYKLYSWKHTGAVMAVRAGVGLKELQLQLRHYSLDQVNEYLRQMGVSDMHNLQNLFPSL